MKRTVAGVLTLALGLMAGTAQAQTSTPAERPVTFGAAVGLNMPMGDAGDALNMGFRLNGQVELHPQSMPVDFRGEISYSRFGFDGVDAHESVLAFVPNVLYHFSTQSRIQPYVIGGLGLYHISTTADAGQLGTVSVSDTKAGINVGGGLGFPLSNSRASLFVEARYHHIFTDGGSFDMVPITFGVSF